MYVCYILATNNEILDDIVSFICFWIIDAEHHNINPPPVVKLALSMVFQDFTPTLQLSALYPI